MKNLRDRIAQKRGSEKSASSEPKAPGRDGRPAEFRGVGRENVIPVILNAAPLEFLYSKGMLHGDLDAHGAAYRRFSAGQRLRGIFEGAEISGLKAANLEGASGGGMPGRLPGEYKMDCIRWLAELRGPDRVHAIRPGLFKLLEAVIYEDRWVWESVRQDRQKSVILRLHKALDLLSVRFQMMAARDFNARWATFAKGAEYSAAADLSPDHHSAE